MADDPQTRDANQLGEHDSPEMKFPGMPRPAFRVYFDPAVHDQIQRHAGQDTSVEVGGVLVGDWHHDADGPFVAVTRSIRCDAATSKSGEVTFTHEAWNAIHREMDTRYSDLRIVGWYHTHPTFGIFLSERDTFIHEHFFSNPGQIAYVVDPVAETEGVFAWCKGKPALVSHYWVGERICAGADKAAQPAPRVATAKPPAQAATDDRDSMVSVPAIVRLAAICLAVFLIGYLVASTRSAWEQRMIVEGAVAHYGIWKGLRPGLREDLQKADAGLDKIASAVEELAKEHVAVAGEEATQKREAWNQVRDALRQTREALAETNDRYALSEEESRMAARMIAAREAQLYGVRDAEQNGAASRGEPAKDAPPMPPAQKNAPASAGAVREKQEKKNDTSAP